MVRSNWQERPCSAKEAKQELEALLKPTEKTVQVAEIAPQKKQPKTHHAAPQKQRSKAHHKPPVAAISLVILAAVGVIGIVNFTNKSSVVEAGTDASQAAQVGDDSQAFEKAVDWRLQGDTAFQAGRYEEAIASYDKAVAIKPDYHEAWSNRGASLGRLGRYEEAIASFDKALEFKPDDETYRKNRNIATNELGLN